MPFHPDLPKPIPLSVLQQDPDVLIIPQFSDGTSETSRVKAVPFKAGRTSILGDDFQYPLSIIIANQRYFNIPTNDQEGSNDRWGYKLNAQRRSAIAQQAISPCDQVLASVLAREYYPNGVFVELIMIASHLRGYGVGAQFLDNFGKVMKQMGYLYTVGIIDEPSNMDYFFDRRYLPDAIGNERVRAGLDCYTRQGIPTVAFLDRATELEWVRPEFLLSS